MVCVLSRLEACLFRRGARRRERWGWAAPFCDECYEKQDSVCVKSWFEKLEVVDKVQ